MKREGERRSQRVHPCSPRSQVLQSYRASEGVHPSIGLESGHAHPGLCLASVQALKANLSRLLHVRIWLLKIRGAWMSTNLSSVELSLYDFCWIGAQLGSDLIGSTEW